MVRLTGCGTVYILSDKEWEYLDPFSNQLPRTILCCFFIPLLCEEKLDEERLSELVELHHLFYNELSSYAFGILPWA